MATEMNLETITLEAAADLSSNQFELVKVDSSGKAALCAAITDLPAGVLVNKPTSGQSATVVVAGRAKVKAGAAITLANDRVLGLRTGATSKAGEIIPGTDTTQFVFGQALETAAGANEIFEALVSFRAPTRAA